MKKITYTLLLLMGLTSCNKFLDVKPESQIDKTELFSTQQGFKEALNGVYTLCSSQALYGENLTFGNLDIMAQNYEFSDITYRKVAAFDYAYKDVADKNAQIWENAYRAIANCNHILDKIDEQKALFTGKNYEIIKAETLTLRAYLHFDLLRMFAPSYKSNPAGKGIPYVTTVTTTSTKFSTVTEVLDKVITDLTAAKKLMADSDPITLGYTVGYPGYLGAPEVNNPDLFLQNRRHRMNYYTVCGELARAYLYKNDMANCLANTSLIIDQKRFPWTEENDFFENDVTKRDRIFYKELIGAWYINDNNILQTRLVSLFANNQPLFVPSATQIDDIYERSTSGAEDWRYKQWFFFTTLQSGVTESALLQKYLTNAAPMKNKHPLVAPALRLSEIYYMAAEAAFDSDPATAVEYYNTVRRHRGIGDDLTGGVTKQQFLDLLLTEARKEFYGESQVFFMYKRLNHAVKLSSTQSIPASDRVFVFPIPVDEQAYNN
jgi:hypothetical protein